MTFCPTVTHFSEPQSYSDTFLRMQNYTLQRSSQTPDAIWFLEHEPVFTQGQAGKPEHLLNPKSIPVIQSDRGGQITYHGPGQLMIYTLIDLKRLNLSIKPFIHLLEQSVIDCLSHYGIQANIKPGAPGVYTADAKIASLGLRVKRGCTYHGLSLNVNMDLSPFTQINPCGFSNLKMTQIRDFIPDITVNRIIHDITPVLLKNIIALEPSYE